VSTFCQESELGEWVKSEKMLNIQRLSLSEPSMQRLWLVRDFDQSCEALAQQRSISQRLVSIKYGAINVPDYDNTAYAYNDQLGFVKI